MTSEQVSTWFLHVKIIYICTQPLLRLPWKEKTSSYSGKHYSTSSYYSLICLHLKWHIFWDNVLCPCGLFQLPPPWESSEREKETITLKYTDLSSLAKERLWGERLWGDHLKSLPKRGMNALLSVSAFNHERAPHAMYTMTRCPWTNNNIQWNHQLFWSQVLRAHNTLNGTISLWA